MKALEQILQEYFGFKQSVFYKKNIQVPGGEECITKRGQKEVEKLRNLLYDLHVLGVIKETSQEIDHNIDRIILEKY